MRVEQRHRFEVAAVVAIGPHLLGWERPIEIVDDIFARRQIDLQIGALLGRKFAQTPVENAFGGRHQLDHHRLPLRDMRFGRGDDARQLHREEHLPEEALLGGFEPRPSRRLSARVERISVDRVDHAGQLERGFHVLVDNRLSRGRDNVKERGSDVDSPNAGRCCCAL
ncbi:hypothetical protein, partial [Sphingomonas sp. 67-36]|uniref:hypothetical protein n=1 Tax=Sphingomonas sp. 67-36 TaxID=1895849 RepID=UPI00345204A2